MTPGVKNGMLYLYSKPGDDTERLIACFDDHLGGSHPLVREMMHQRNSDAYATDGLAVPVEPCELQETINCLRMGRFIAQALEVENLSEGHLIGNGEMR